MRPSSRGQAYGLRNYIGSLLYAAIRKEILVCYKSSLSCSTNLPHLQKLSVHNRDQKRSPLFLFLSHVISKRFITNKLLHSLHRSTDCPPGIFKCFRQSSRVIVRHMLLFCSCNGVMMLHYSHRLPQTVKW